MRKQRQDLVTDGYDACPVCMTRSIVLPAMIQVAVSVRENARRVLYLEPKQSTKFRHGFRLANGVRDVASGHLFYLLIANFTKSRSLPQGTVVAYAERNLLALLVPDEKTVRSTSAALYIPSTPSAAGASDADQDYSSGKFLPQEQKQTSSSVMEQATTTDWHDRVDLSHIECGQTRMRIHDMLALHASMWDG